MEFTLIKIETFIPGEYIISLREELNKVGALSVDGVYDYCMAVSKVKGSPGDHLKVRIPSKAK
jgi:hypothetical protein